MRWWKWAAGAIGIAALGAFAALWVLTEADVLRWGAASAIHDRIDALENRAAPAPEPEPTWIVLSREGPIVRVVGQNGILEACVTYTSPAGEQERCGILRINNDPVTEHQQEVYDCYNTARIGDPLPDCWR